MKIVKDLKPKKVPLYELCVGTLFTLWDDHLYVKIPLPQKVGHSNVLNLATKVITDISSDVRVSPVEITEIHIREL